MSVTALPQGGARQIRRRATPAVRPRTEADVYSEIVRAWWSLYPDHLDHAMQRFVVGRNFAHTICSESLANREDTIAACARIVSTERWQLRDAVCVRGDFQFSEVFDPASAWWVPLQEAGESSLGVHFWRLVNGMIELRDIATLDDPPALCHGRFAERERERERKVERSLAERFGTGPKLRAVPGV